MVPLGVGLGSRAGQSAAVRLLCEDPATAPHHGGALVVDDTGDRKDGTEPPMWPASISARAEW